MSTRHDPRGQHGRHRRHGRAHARPDVPPTWPAPIAVGLATAVGLVAALVTDGTWDVTASALLAVPVGAAAWYGLRRATPAARRPPGRPGTTPPAAAGIIAAPSAGPGARPRDDPNRKDLPP